MHNVRVDRLDRLQVFVRVAELSSFSRAADALGMPRTTVSAAVAQLERSLATRLLHRTTRRLHLTPDGEATLARARGLLDEFEAMQSQLRRRDAPIAGRLSVDLPSRIVRLIVVPALPRLLERHPELEIELSAADRIVDLVEEGLDCAIRVGPLASNSLVARPLGAFPLVNCASPGYLAAHGTPMRLADLQEHWAIGYRARPRAAAALSSDWDYVDEHGRPQTLRLRSRVAVNNVETYIACAAAGLGLIQVPAFDVRSAFERQELVEVLPQWRAAPMPVHAVYPHRRHPAPRLKVFLGWIEELLRSNLAPINP